MLACSHTPKIDRLPRKVRVEAAKIADARCDACRDPMNVLSRIGVFRPEMFPATAMTVAGTDEDTFDA